MARAKRHYIAGQVWHITHRCHKRDFLLGFAKDRRRWLQWLFEAKRHYELAILDYVVTSNHIYNQQKGEKDESAGAIRNGRGLLVGLLRCQRCGRKLHVRYWGRGVRIPGICAKVNFLRGAIIANLFPV